MNGFGTPPQGAWQPAGNIKGPKGEPGDIENGEEWLVIGQNYVDIEFQTDQVDESWGVRACSVAKLTPSGPVMNIGIGTVTDKTPSGFRQWLLGAADADGYVLRWSIIGEKVNVVEATSYTMSGPTAGSSGQPSQPFTVKLPKNTTMAVPVTITPSDVLGPSPPEGTFTPAFVTLSTDMPVASFVYTGASGGAKTISVTNDKGLTNPASINITLLGTVIDASFAAISASTDNWNGSSVTYIGQLFSSGGGLLDSARKIIRKLGAPTGNVVAKLYATDGSSILALLATSDPKAISDLTIGDWNTFVFSGANRITLVSGTQYVIAFAFTGGDASNSLGYWYAPDAGAAGFAVSANGEPPFWNMLYSFDTDFELWVVR